MAHQVDDRHRLIVPRWRPFTVSARLGMIDSGGNPPPPLQLAPGEMDKLRADWKRHRTPGHAADLVDASLLVGRPESAVDAAEFLLQENIGPVSRSVAQAVLAPPGTRSGEPPELNRLERYRRIAAAKRSLRRYPRDPLRWVDLAREYSILGQNEQAEEALHRALILAPEDRFVLRAASRFFLHAHDPERAHSVLLGTGRTKQDPWLLAAEIVAARAAEGESRWIRQGRNLVEGGKFAPRHISELAGALGTLDHESGNRRGVGRMFDRALHDPTENTVAQAAWISRHRRSFAPPHQELRVPRAFEAGAWTAATNGAFEAAVEKAWKWLRDEPFTTRPAMFGSWVAATALGDYGTATRFIRTIEQAHSDDPRVIAQLVFCHASMNELEQAEDKLSQMPTAVQRYTSGTDKTQWEVLMAADRGLIAFRRGNPGEGQVHYEEAIRVAADQGLREAAASALLYYAREMARALPGEGRTAIAEARRALDVFPPALRNVYERVLLRAERSLGPCRSGEG